jgi:hypothetical protein
MSHFVDSAQPVDALIDILRKEHSSLFQLRKVGVTLSIPAPVRDHLVTLYGDEASLLLRKIDGDIRL